jgi:phospholipid/cholesterol/gamma-HCH transport system substrate-binding protein/paraquat-inducible protein B
MSTRANHLKIGLFVLTGAALSFAVLIALGAGAFFGEAIPVETYFDGSVQGLEVGSPVKLRGVQIGKVERISFTSAKYELAKPLDERENYILVEMGFSREHFPRQKPEGFSRLLRSWIDEGLRVRLTAQGVTGLSYLELDYLASPELYPVVDVPWEPAMAYIPSAPGIVQTLTDSVESISRTLKQLEKSNLGGIAANVDELVVGVTKLVTDDRVDALHSEAVQLLAEARRTNDAVRELIEKSELDQVLVDAHAAVSLMRRVGEASEAELTAAISDVGRTARHLEAATDELPETIGQLNRTLRRLGTLLTEEQRDIANTIANIESISANLRELSESAKRYPAYTIFGGPPPPIEIAEPKE